LKPPPAVQCVEDALGSGTGAAPGIEACCERRLLMALGFLGGPSCDKRGALAWGLAVAAWEEAGCSELARGTN
jgi:hypothetical protein